ncbi:MAG: hypothetical protein H5T76_36800 [Streptomyces sp.]|nr:hypothetical protein [Streptomyces sp.]
MDGTIVGPLSAGHHNTALQVQKTPASGGESALRHVEVDDFRRAHRGVVHAAEEGIQVRTMAGKRLDRFKQAGDLRGVRHALRVDFVGDLGRRPTGPGKWILAEVTTLDCDSEDLIDGRPSCGRPLALHGLGSCRAPLDFAAQSIKPSSDVWFL